MGVGPADLDTLIVDTLGTCTCKCESLPNIMFQKTKGNTIFMLEFLMLLADGGRVLLEHDPGEHQWLWGKDYTSTIDMTGCVMHLLSSNIGGLSKTTQLALKVVSCFRGI